MTKERLVRYVLFLVVFMLFSVFSYAGNKQDFKAGEMNPAFEAFIQNKDNTTKSVSSTNQHKLGLIPAPFLLRKHKVNSSRLSIINLPSYYDLRQTSYLTPIKNQGAYGTCWAFATYGSLESDLLFEGEPAYDFSENNLVNKSGFTDSVDGGSIDVSSAYLASGKGPVEASCDPYPNIGNSPDNCSRVKYIEDINYLPPRSSATDNYPLKLAVYQHGAVITGMYWADGYYNKDNATYYYDGTQHGNHAVVIVGWDDNKVVPGAPGKGAWIIRNSWGSSWGDNGYFYISYYDTIMGTEMSAYYVDETDINNGNFNIYQYDLLGMEFGYHCSNNNYVYGANVFTASSPGKIEAVSLFTKSPTSYEIDIYTHCSNPNDIAHPPVDIETGQLDHAGYHTIKLKNHIIVDEGVKFCIVARLSQEDNESNPLGIEGHIVGYTDNAVGAPGESFISCDNGTTWSDLYTTFYKSTGDTNVCLKALYVNAEPIIISFSYDTDLQYYVGDNVTFKAVILDNNSASYTWNFGDGTIVTNDNNTAIHSYSKPGIYVVALTVRDSNFNVEEKGVRVLVKPVNGDIDFARNPINEDSLLYLFSYNSTIDSFTAKTPEEAQYDGDIDMSTMPESISPKMVVLADLDNVTVGGTATIEIKNIDIKDNSTFYKYANGEWTNLKDDDCNFKIIDNKTISFDVTDGGPLDNDGLENGKISDPVVIGTTTSTPPAPTPTPTSSSGGGCVASNSSSGMGLIFIILTAFAFAIKRKMFLG